MTALDVSVAIDSGLMDVLAFIVGPNAVLTGLGYSLVVLVFCFS